LHDKFCHVEQLSLPPRDPVAFGGRCASIGVRAGIGAAPASASALLSSPPGSLPSRSRHRIPRQRFRCRCYLHLDLCPLRTRLCSQMAEPPQLLHVLLRRSCSQMLVPPHSRQKCFSRVCGHFLRTAGIPHSAHPLVSLRYQPAITALPFVLDLHTSCARLGRSSCDHRITARSPP
jgi:hypothetical protein